MDSTLSLGTGSSTHKRTIGLDLVADLDAGLGVVMGVAFQRDLVILAQRLAEPGEEIDHVIHLVVGHVQVVRAASAHSLS